MRLREYQQTLSVIRAGLGILHGSRALGGPIQASVDVTNRCNIRCAHCYYRAPGLTLPNLPEVRWARIAKSGLPAAGPLRETLRVEADGEKVHSLLSRLLDLGTRRFQFSGNGEAFIHPEMMEFAARVKSREAFCVTNTNGTLLDGDKMKRLVEIRFDELRISMLAGTKEVYIRTHPGVREDMFDRLHENLLHLAEWKRSLGARRPVLSLVMVIMSHSAGDQMNIARLAEEVGAENVIYRVIDDVHDPALNQLVLSEEQRVEARKQLGEAARFLDDRGIGHNIPNVLQVVRTQLDTTEFHRIVPCYYGWLAARINADGEVRPCCRCYMSMGNAFEQDFKEIWYGEKYRRFRREAITVNKRRTPVSECDCNSCPHHNANLRVYKALHPVRWRLKRSRLDYLNSQDDGE
jgi:MoaA/NifB/PqqE/SkfB family radical SAM enzyme